MSTVLPDKLTSVSTQKVVVSDGPWLRESVELVDPLLGDMEVHEAVLFVNFHDLLSLLSELHHLLVALSAK